MTDETIYPKVAEILADVLALDESEIAPDKRLVNDLNAESIDFLDIMFRLERGFKVKIPRGKIEEDVRALVPEGAFEQAGKLTPAALTALKGYLDEVPEEYFSDTLKVDEIPTLFTVKTLCRLIERAKTHDHTGEKADANV